MRSFALILCVIPLVASADAVHGTGGTSGNRPTTESVNTKTPDAPAPTAGESSVIMEKIVRDLGGILASAAGLAGHGGDYTTGERSLHPLVEPTTAGRPGF